jgi:hypothetical protein
MDADKFWVGGKNSANLCTDFASLCVFMQSCKLSTKAMKLTTQVGEKASIIGLAGQQQIVTAMCYKILRHI